MRSDTELHDDVLAELRWDQRLWDEDVAVAVRKGVVTLAGTVETYARRHVSEQAVERVNGVRAIVNDLMVKRPAAPSARTPTSLTPHSMRCAGASRSPTNGSRSG
jgi:hypothetical protein